jgi:hypothetical protein
MSLLDGYKGRIVGPEPENEADHFIECGTCGQLFDARVLAEVFYHAPSHHARKEAH